MRLGLTLAVLSCSAACLFPLAARADMPRYGLTVIGALYSTAGGINNGGDVVGSFYSGSVEHAFIYSGGAMKDIGTLGGQYISAQAINDSGTVVGFGVNSAGLTRGFSYSGGAMHEMGTLGGDFSAANGINNAGQIVGSTALADGSQRAFVYSAGTMQNIGTLPSTGELSSRANVINNAGMIGGSSTIADYSPFYFPSPGFLYSGGVMTNIGSLDGPFGTVLGLNEMGQAVGRTGSAEMFGDVAFLYSGGVMSRLGTLAGDDHASAIDINNLGQIVGVSGASINERAFLYEHGVMLDLNAMIDPASGWTLTSAIGINDHQQIAGEACKDGECFAVRLDLICAVPEPATWSMLLGGLALLGARARRRQ